MMLPPQQNHDITMHQASAHTNYHDLPPQQNHDILMHNNKFVKESTPISLETRASVDSP
jgi:hypothetical protein